MKIFPKQRMRVADGLHLLVPNHFVYTDFGIRELGEACYDGRRFVMTDAPGTGFIVRATESYSYNKFVRSVKARQRHSYLRLLLGLEPDFDRTIEAVGKALQQSTDPYGKELLECYANALTIARTEERVERIIRGIKDGMHHRSNRYLESVLNHYKSRIRQLERDMVSVVWHVKDHCSAETYEAYRKVVEAFAKVASSRRIWFYDKTRRKQYVQVFFDLGVFDFIHSEVHLPLLRTPEGVTYYLLPDAMIVARSSVDFDVVPLKTLTVVCQELAIEESHESMVGRLGDAASMIRIPEFNLTFFFYHVRPVVHFVRALDKLKETL